MRAGSRLTAPVAAPAHHGWARADPPRRPVLFINPASGGGKARHARLADASRERDIEPVVLEPDHDLGRLAESAAAGGADALGMAGGDGSLAAVASVARAHGLPFVCVPAGTRNHFARDLGVPPSDLVGSLDAFGDGLERRIDLGDVNGRVFLNNVTLGIYGLAVQREGYRGAKLRTLVETASEVLGPSAELPAARLVDDRGEVHTDPAVVLVSNNPYALDRRPTAGMRAALDSGRLGILVLFRPGDPRHGPGRGWTARSLRVTAAEPLAAGVDGEAIRVSPPVEFAIVPRALRVRVSSRHVLRSRRRVHASAG